MDMTRSILVLMDYIVTKTKSSMKTVFYTIIGDSHYHGCRTDEFIKSFKRWHPDIDLVVFGQKEINETFATNPKLNFYNAKPTFAKKLYNDYELVVNIDSDFLIFERLTEILEGDYDVAAGANYNAWLNSGIGTNTFANTCGVFSSNVLIPYELYLQGGLVASTSKVFWDQYEYASLNYSDVFGNKENDILNILSYMLPYNVKVLDGHYDYRHEEFKCYYNCASLGREDSIIVNNDRLELDGKPVKAYHFARGGSNKPHPKELFRPDVVDFIYKNIVV
jgi:hypothetical protein